MERVGFSVSGKREIRFALFEKNKANFFCPFSPLKRYTFSEVSKFALFGAERERAEGKTQDGIKQDPAKQVQKQGPEDRSQGNSGETRCVKKPGHTPKGR